MYTCPNPTKEQKELGKKLGYDPYDRCGSGLTDTGASDVLCAACLIHDELFLVGGPEFQLKKVNQNFKRDVFILADSVEDRFERYEAIIKAELYVADVDMFSRLFWRSQDRNTNITRFQGQRAMAGAFSWINECARKLGQIEPYPEIKFCDGE